MRTLSVFLISILLWSSHSYSDPQDPKASAFKQKAFNASAISAIDASLYAICMKWAHQIRISLPKKHSECANAVHKYTFAIDFEFFQMQNTSVAVVFRKSMLEVLSKPKTTGFLKQVIQDLENFKSAPSEDLVLNKRLTQWYPKDAERFEMLATIFQDTSPLVAQVVWLEENKSNLSSDQMANLESLLKIAEIWQEDELRQMHLTGFPNYHAYVPGYLAHLLDKNEVSHWANFSMSYGFNYLYEYLSLRHKKVEKTTYLNKSKYRQQIDVGDVWPAYESVMKVINPNGAKYTFPEFQKHFSNPKLHQVIALDLFKN